jgi:hypothetical protein
LLLRGSRSFDSREEYVDFVENLVKRANDNRQKNFLDDLAHLNRLPDERLDTDDIQKGVKVSSSSTIRVPTNTYSVRSRLIGQLVDLRSGAEQMPRTLTASKVGCYKPFENIFTNRECNFRLSVSTRRCGITRPQE